MVRSTLLSALWLLAAAAFAQHREVRNPHTTPADVAAGARIFRGHCAECHGLKGEGGRGPSLTTGVFYHGSTDEDLLNNITDGIPGTSMPGVFFSSDQVWQLVSYVRSLSAAKTQPPRGNIARGETIFREKGCFGCHLVRGEGGVNGPDLSLIGSQRSPEHLRDAIVALENGKTYTGFILNEDTHTLQMLEFQQGLQSLAKRDFNRFSVEKTSTMPSFARQLKDGELEDLVAYLHSLQRKGGSR
jgi:putative heme-binding domain-containing protein